MTSGINAAIDFARRRAPERDRLHHLLEPRRYPSSGRVIAILVCGLIATMPLFSAARGISQPLGRGLMAATDAVMILLFVWTISQPGLRLLKLTIIALIGLSLLNFLLWTASVDPATIYQGFRKSLLWLFAITIGYSIQSQYRNTLLWTIIVTCTAICAYAIKQWLLGFTTFDYQLLDAQAALTYANMIGGYQRAISVLSSGFHVGMAGSLIILCALTIQPSSSLKRFFTVVALVLIGSLAIYASFTRTFMIIAGALSLLRIAQLSHAPLVRVGLYTIASCVFVLGVFGGYFTEVSQALLSDDRFTSRSYSYEKIAQMFSENPMGILTGFGLGSAGSTLGIPFARGGAQWVEPHNAMLKYVVEFGLPLSLVLLWQIVTTVVQARPNPRLGFDSSLSYFCIALLAGAGLTITSVEAWPISLYLGLIIGMLAAPAAEWKPFGHA